ncbi:hypothetical protein G5B40_20590 [Pikeienuella piscinae]|uniref:Polysaccharide chain length determinant N-terminal domain-containing protein n=1 Tax=Pikeienuella piscinae TaxID=2748098 RepID=A0A7M3T6K6_9RHOB|nr:Wzz/FepE/Etk N-terminal domain-containing protein [Pikeienuella piscinae]QIE57637.1 hypothetical protein G5B40_20590 [Pikeienuella piscinae]
MADGASMGLGDILGIVRRRAWIVALCFVLLTPLGVGVAYILPPVYSATARILVESQQIPDELARSTVTASAAERLELIRQRLMTRRNLIELIDKYKLYDGFEGMSISDKVDRLREDAVFASVAFGDSSARRAPSGVAAFTISFDAPSPVLAAKIANEFVTMALDLNLKQRTERATETVAFFRSETGRLSRQILDLENQIVAFKGEHADALPDTVQYRAGELARLEAEISDGEERRSVLEEQRREIELALSRGLAGLTDETLSPEQQQIKALQNTLAQQRGILAPTHPTIRALEARIQALQREITPATDENGEQVDPLEYQKARLKRQAELITAEIEKLEQRGAENKKKADDLRVSISRAPQVEVELSSLTRRLGELRNQYTVAAAKLAEAETGERMEVNRQAERLVVIEQAQVPTEPKSPNRLMIASLGAGVSIMIGVAFVALLELLNNTIRTSGDLQRKVNLRPVVVVPYIHTRQEIRSRRWRLALIAFAILVGVPATLFAIDQYYLPLSVLAEKLAEKTGLNEVISMIERRF